nr:Na+/H+ antiporter NhaA [Actinomycetota bacterium]
HATIAGVMLGLLAPNQEWRGQPVIGRLEHVLHPWTSFLVVPLFALANAGVALGADSIADAATSRVTLGVVLGLVVGKTLGIGAAVATAVRFGLGKLPDGVGGLHVVGAAAVAGIGFTVSLFIAELSFGGSARLTDAKVGILAGSLISGIAGALVLLWAGRRSLRR